MDRREGRRDLPRICIHDIFDRPEATMAKRKIPCCFDKEEHPRGLE
jgi:hypothetical protein